MRFTEADSTFTIDGTDHPCQWTRSSRARYMRLRVNAEGVIRITMPVFTPRDAAFRFLQEQTPWLRRALLKMKEYRQKKQSDDQHEFFPDALSLPFFNRTFHVEYVWYDAPWLGAKLDPEAGTLIFTGNVLKSALLYPAFSALLKRIASVEFPVMLRELSIRLQIPYSRCTVRLQSGRWGSCSTRGNISMNAMLLFFPKELTEYVMVHELCHRKHMNHSADFWALVSRYVPDWKSRRSRLNREADRLPVMFRNLQGR